jgi:hypothetical protein
MEILLLLMMEIEQQYRLLGGEYQRHVKNMLVQGEEKLEKEKNEI